MLPGKPSLTEAIVAPEGLLDSSPVFLRAAPSSPCHFADGWAIVCVLDEVKELSVSKIFWQPFEN